MTRKIILSLVISFITILFLGEVSLLFIIMLFSGYYGSFDFTIFFVGTGINFVFAGLLCVFVLFPIALIEKDKIQSLPVEELFKRYLPIIVFPPAILFCFVLFSHPLTKDNYFGLIIILNVLCTGYIGLWTFLKRLKS